MGLPLPLGFDRTLWLYILVGGGLVQGGGLPPSALIVVAR